MTEVPDPAELGEFGHINDHNAMALILTDHEARLGGQLVTDAASYTGYDGTGATDSAAAIRLAIADAISTTSRTVLLTGSPKVESTIALGTNERGITIVGTSKARGTRIDFTGTGPLFEMGTDTHVGAHESSWYDGPQSFYVRDISINVPASVHDATLDNGEGGYKAGTYAIRDWYGGDVVLDNVDIEHFEFGFWGLQSDLNHFINVIITLCQTGIYLGPRSDQFNGEGLYFLLNDCALDLDRVSGCSFDHCSFVGNGAEFISPISIGTAWTIGSNGVFFDDCWFEHFQGYSGTLNEFVAIGVGDSVTSKNIHFRNPTILTNESPTEPRTSYFLKCEATDVVSIENPNGQFWTNITKLIQFVGSTSPHVFLTSRQSFDTAFGTVNSGSGAPGVTTMEWGGYGTAGGVNFGNASIAIGALNAQGGPHQFGSSGSSGVVSEWRSAAGNNRDIQFSTGTTSRWIIRANNVAEGGSDTGTEFNISARTDAGADVGSILTGKRSGDVSLGISGKKTGFYGGTGAVKPTVSGSRAGNAALASLLTALANLNLITDSTS